MNGLMTIRQTATAELEEKGSRFLGVLTPYAMFDETLAGLRDQHRKASHHVTAFRHMRDDDRIEEGARDDGEPAGTSGMPILKVMIGENIIDAGIIVVRYFGGIKLGSGGLARAYSGTAIRLIGAAHLVPWHRIVERTITCSFQDASSLEQLAQSLNLTVTSRTFDEAGCSLTVRGPEARVGQMAGKQHG